MKKVFIFEFESLIKSIYNLKCKAYVIRILTFLLFFNVNVISIEPQFKELLA